MSSTCNNSFYTRIQAFGTASAFDPHYIMKAGSIGPPNGESCGSSSSQNSTKTIDVNVDVSEASACKIYCLGNEIPRNCVITNVSMNANNSLTDQMFSAIVGVGVSASGAIGCDRDKPALVYGYLEGAAVGDPNVYSANSINSGTALEFLDPPETVFNIIQTPSLQHSPCTGSTIPNTKDGPIFPVLQILTASTPTPPSPCCPCPCPPIINAKITYFCP